jgi:hypothetical protein
MWRRSFLIISRRSSAYSSISRAALPQCVTPALLCQHAARPVRSLDNLVSWPDVSPQEILRPDA